MKDSRPTEDGSAIRRRRQCEDCGARFTTFERTQLREITVLKSDDRREPFDRAVILQAIVLQPVEHVGNHVGDVAELGRAETAGRAGR